MTTTSTRSADLGLTDLRNEITRDELPIEGELPSWLSGSVLRSGPASWNAGSSPLQHWFDGLAMLHRFTIADGRVSYANKYLDSDVYRSTKESGELTYQQFATDPCRSIFERFQSLFSDDTPDNNNINVGRLGERFLALGETSIPVEFDQRTLESAGVPYQAPGQLTTAHPHYDGETGVMYNYATKLARRSSYRIYKATEQGAEVLADIPVGKPAYMHSFGMTEHYFVLTEFPLVVNPAALALSGKPFIENFRWQPERGTKITLIDRRTGEVAARHTAEAFFAFHHINAYEDGDDVVVDLCAYEDPGIIQDLYLDRLREIMRLDAGNVAGAHLKRLRLTGSGVRSEWIGEANFDLPRINDEYGEKPNRYVWGAGVGQGWLDHLVKLDTTDGTSLTWEEPDRYPGEPIFVARPGSEREDDGVLLSLVLDARRENSSLVVLDAATMRPLARAEVPHHIPYGFHGHFSRS